MTKQEQFRQNEINKLAYVLDKVKLDAISTIGSLNNGFGQWYAKAAYSVKELFKEQGVELTCEEVEA